MQTKKIADLKFMRAGSDFIPMGWTGHVDAPQDASEFNQTYLLEREDGSTFQVTAIHRRDSFEGRRCWMLVDDQLAMMMDF